MNRRDTVAALLALGSAGIPLHSLAQSKSKVWRIGSVHGLSAVVSKPYEEAFLAGMRERGYELGRNLIFDQRFAAGDNARYPALVDEIVALKPDVLIGANTAVAIVMKSSTQTIPIVLATSGDPVGDGLVKSLAQPGGNVTGVSLQLGELGGKHVELLGDLLPQLRQVALIVDATGPQYQVDLYVSLAKAAAASKGYALQVFRIDALADIRSVLLAIEARRPDALAVFLSPRLNSNRREFAERAASMRLPSIAHQEGYPRDGGLMSYGPSFEEGWRRVAYFVDRIVKGAKPADLPIEQPTKFSLVLNARTAKSFGLRIPDLIQVRTNRVIE
jgi:putative ABC transport system substrate-binding protein